MCGEVVAEIERCSSDR